MKILIIAEIANSKIHDNSLKVITAGKKLGGEIHLLFFKDVISNELIELATKIDGVNKVIICKNPAFKNEIGEDVVDLILPIASTYNFILASASSTAKNFMPRLAGILDVEMISEITEIIDSSTFKRPTYAGNAIETVQSNQNNQIITVRASSFEKTSIGNNKASTQEIQFTKKFTKTKFVSLNETKSDSPELTSARIVVSGGRGVKSKENFKIIEGFAKKLGAAVGATRAAVDAGFAPNDYQVGQTGKIVAPEIYFAIGLSGAIQHLAGMKESKIIIAINTDAQAPIFEIATYGLVEDLFKAIPEIEQKL
ncbi:MAG: electron transfer flavoprotein subunit alpha/FixB family protein [Alphaproteobacteria bacterium]|jgi:electron transfer flavoprotein alpha subunit